MKMEAMWTSLFSIVFLLLDATASSAVNAETRAISGLDPVAVASFMCDEAPNGSSLPPPEPVFYFPPEFQIPEPTGVCGRAVLTDREGTELGTFYFVAIAIDPVMNVNDEIEMHITSISEYYPVTGGVLLSGEYDIAVINTATLRAHHAISIGKGSVAEIEPGEGLVEIDEGHIFIQGGFLEPLFQPVFDSNGQLTDVQAKFEGVFAGFLRGEEADDDDRVGEDEDDDD